jgi:small GTP-binding protein
MPTDSVYIKQLEKEIGIGLTRQDPNELLQSKKSGYSIDEDGNVTELSLYKVKLTSLPIGLSNFKNIDKLVLFTSESKDYSSLSTFKQLTYLDLTGNKIEDISFLAGMKQITHLFLGENQITDISPLRGLIGLTVLDLLKNELEDVSSLKNLSSLNSLDMRFNKVSDISPLQGLSGLIYLNLTKNNIADISSLKELFQLTYLDMQGNDIEDISPLSRLKNLSYLNLTANKIKDILPLKRLTDLTLLSLSRNQITDISAIQWLRHLRELILNNNKITDLSPLQGLKELTRLDLWENQIADILPLRWLKNLTHLNLIGNKIEDISPLAVLRNLIDLNAADNYITDIIPLQELTNLLDLDLSENNITDIPPLKELTNLSYLDLSENNITDISPLRNLTDLEKLNLSENKISDIAPLGEIKNLKQLHLSGCGLPHVSPLQKLVHLTRLNLSYNRINDVRDLAGLQGLNFLFLNNNQIEFISPLLRLKELERLDLSNNRIFFLPAEILDLNLNIQWGHTGNEKAILFANNPLETPPKEIVKLGTVAVQNFFESNKKMETVRLLESKLLIVGNGEVGKTSLMRKLKDNDFQIIEGNEPTTHGLNIVPWELECPFPDSKNEKIKVHIWDFGGQAIYHSTHQFFLTKRSLYLFVWEARKEEEAQTFDYWLNIIKLLSKESPVIVVMNKSDLRIKHLDEANFKDKFDNIVTFLQVSCLTGEGIDKLTEQIRQTLGGMPHLQDLLPKVWKQIRDRLKQDDRDYIGLEDYFNICRAFDMDREKAMFLSDYLHDLGVILHYHDSVLENTVILNPEWATEAVYNLINTRQIQVDKGRFQFAKLKEYWDTGKFPPSKHLELVRLMEKFELCFKIVGTDTYIIPELLPPERPTIDIRAYQGSHNLRFQYKYDFMPGGIISRFISRVYYLIKGDHYWKNAVELRFEHATALVKSEPLDRKITVSISGKDKSELLGIIRNDLEHIHATLNMEKDTHYKELIPCVCAECTDSEAPYYHRYDVLRLYREKGKDTVPCLKSAEDVSIARLLKGVEPESGLERLDLLQALLDASQYLQGIAKSIQPYEDSRNDFITALLTSKGLVVKDQSRWGVSATGKTIGRPDFRVFNPESGEEAVVEAFNLEHLAKGVIDMQLRKLFHYDSGGQERNFVLVYCDTSDFLKLWQKYLDHIAEIEFEHPLTVKPEEQKTKLTDIKLARAVHLRSGKETQVFHIFINMNR